MLEVRKINPVVKITKRGVNERVDKSASTTTFSVEISVARDEKTIYQFHTLNI